jgi:hypothetical protein
MPRLDRDALETALKPSQRWDRLLHVTWPLSPRSSISTLHSGVYGVYGPMGLWGLGPSTTGLWGELGQPLRDRKKDTNAIPIPIPISAKWKNAHPAKKPKARLCASENDKLKLCTNANSPG